MSAEDIEATCSPSAKRITELETELAAVTKKLELCMAANSDVRRIALERDSFESQLAAERAKVAKLREALQRISQWGFGWDGDCGICDVATTALAETAPKEEEK